MATPTLYAVLIQWKCTRTHHKLALDALRHLHADHAEAWRNLFLRHVEPYLAGTTAPDERFGDFKNHVVHVAEKSWGGAPAAAEAWYLRTLAELKARRWKKAVYSAGILSHYYFDPLQTFHTGETPEAGVLRRPVDWAISQAYPELQQILEQDLGGYPEIAVPSGGDWLSRMVLAGAAAAHTHYEVLIDHFDLARSVRRPADGFDQECRDRMAGLLGHSAAGWARILDRLFKEAEVEPPRVRIGSLGLLARMTIPIFWFTHGPTSPPSRLWRRTSPGSCSGPAKSWRLSRTNAGQSARSTRKKFSRPRSQTPTPPNPARSAPSTAPANPIGDRSQLPGPRSPQLRKPNPKKCQPPPSQPTPRN